MALTNELPAMWSEFPTSYLVGYGGAVTLFAFSAFSGARTSVYLRLTSWLAVFLISFLNSYAFGEYHSLNMIDKFMTSVVGFFFFPPTNFVVSALTIKTALSVRSPKITTPSGIVIFFILMLLHILLTIYVRYVAS